MGCCSVRSVGVTVGLLSLLMSSQLLLPTVLSLLQTEDSTLLHSSLSWLHTIHHNHHLDNATRQDMDIFIDGLIWNVDNSSVVTLVISCLNLLTTLLMILGSCCQLSWLMLPWLVLAMVELLTLALPAAVFFSLVGVYLYFKGLLMVSILVTAVPASLLLLNLILWLVVLGAYNRHQPAEECQETEEERESCQPLIGGGQPAGSYSLDQYPQYYPHHPPSAPPSNTPPGQVYPSLPAT